jgi:hypothetical protein
VIRPLAVAAAACALLVPSSGSAQATKLRGTVGPEFTITFVDASGARVTQLDPGDFEAEIDDRSEFHNFHLTGPAGSGIDRRTGVEAVERVTWQLRLVAGQYRYVCDIHPGTMNGGFNVGAAPPTPPPPPPTPPPARPGRLIATVGPGNAIAVRTPAGRAVRTTRSGLYTVAVRDRSRTQNFHLTGPGVNRKTGVAFRGSVAWQLRVRKGATYRFVSDASRARLRGSFRGT